MKLGSLHGEINPLRIKFLVDSCFLSYQFQEGKLMTWKVSSFLLCSVVAMKISLTSPSIKIMGKVLKISKLLPSYGTTAFFLTTYVFFIWL